MKRTLLLLFFFVSLSLLAEKQYDSRLDSLIQLTSKYQGSRLVDVFIEIAKIQGASDIELANKSADEAIRLAKNIKYVQGIGKAYLAKGTICNFNNAPLKGEEYFKEAKRIFSTLEDNKNLALANSGLGESYSQRGNFEDALNAYKLATYYFESIGDFKLLANIYSKTGTTYNMIDDYHNALLAY
ncbi:MAG: tetratricopeptide repeat protein, partial [Bacteroidales bacterium]|nr:tetratricopeptide repeat protein [Bacteroidales bacterium]